MRKTPEMEPTENHTKDLRIDFNDKKEEKTKKITKINLKKRGPNCENTTVTRRCGIKMQICV